MGDGMMSLSYYHIACSIFGVMPPAWKLLLLASSGIVISSDYLSVAAESRLTSSFVHPRIHTSHPSKLFPTLLKSQKGETGTLKAKVSSKSKTSDRIKAAKKKSYKNKKKQKRSKKTTNSKDSASFAKKDNTGSSGDANIESSSPALTASQQHENNIYIQFSRVFQRHVVYKRNNNISNDNGNSNGVMDEVIQSFEFLDDAVKTYPRARVLAPKDLPFPPPSCSLVYPDDEVNGSNIMNHLVSRGRAINTDVEEEECETTIAGMGLWTLCELEYDPAYSNSDYQYDEAHKALRTLLQLVSSDSSFVEPRHFFRLDSRRFAMRAHTPESITRNYGRIVNMLSQGNAGDGTSFVLQNFPQLCLYDCSELESLVKFLLQPLPPDSIPSVAMVADRVGGAVSGRSGAGVDWPALAGQGYGAGLTVDQASSAIRMMPELLALYYEDSRKPSLVYIYNQMQFPIPPHLVDEASVQLNLEGTDPTDQHTFAYLNSIGISWSQLRILSSSLPLWTTCALEPGWELLQKGPIRSMLKRPSLDYLRQRLQIGPSDVFRLLKTHTRISTYDACKKIMPILDKLQIKLDLSSSGLRKLILRMPSLMGMGISAFDSRIDFFVNEAKMSTDNLREAVLKQPSLLQYSLNSSLRPKLHFFVHELGVPQSSISRIVKFAPAVMGLSLTDNLRPKVVSIMKMCELSPHEVGYIVSTSPQILLLSQKRKIQPALKYLAPTLMLTEARELGELILKVPRVLNYSLETTLKKVEMLTESNVQNGKEVDSKFLRSVQNSKEIAVNIIRKNPTILVTSTAILEERIQRCPADQDMSTYLRPSNRGRRKARAPSAAINVGDIILSSPSLEAAFTTVTRIFPNIQEAANELGADESSVLEAFRNRVPVNGFYLYSPSDSIPILSQRKSNMTPSSHSKIIPVSLFCSGSTYPSDSVDFARGQTRTGGVAIQVFSDYSSHDKNQFLQAFSAAAKSCFGIRVPLQKDDDGSKLVAVFPLVNPSKHRCELFACSGALRILEAFLKNKQKEEGILYDIKVYTESNYAWKLLKSEDKLLELGSYFYSHEMLEHLDLPGYSVNIDILNPLSRCFSRLNGHEEPALSVHQPFHNSKVEFIHSMDGINPSNRGYSFVKSLNRQARSAAKWQYNRERNLVQ